MRMRIYGYSYRYTCVCVCMCMCHVFVHVYAHVYVRTDHVQHTIATAKAPGSSIALTTKVLKLCGVGVYVHVCACVL